MSEPAQFPETSWTELLADRPPNQACRARGVARSRHSNSLEIATPELQLWCDEPTCSGFMLFEAIGDSPWLSQEKWTYEFLHYRCKHCEKTDKHFAIVLVPPEDREFLGPWLAIKLGELPMFGPVTPPKVISMLGPDKSLYLKGRRAESHNLGIGAFGYYRRVVERQKNRLIDEIIRVAKRVRTPEAAINKLEGARLETQFQKAVEQISDAVPAVLLIDGHNPLTLLHAALSRGLHEQSDEKCLELAQSIRIVLVRLAENVRHAMREEDEVKAALASLFDAPQDGE